jgi:hypothetical protein
MLSDWGSYQLSLEIPFRITTVERIAVWNALEKKEAVKKKQYGYRF